MTVKLLFLLTFMTFYITTISTVFFATGYVKDKLDVINSIKGWSYIVEIAILIFSLESFLEDGDYMKMASLQQNL